MKMNLKKLISKIWEILTLVFAGMIIGIVVFIKFLDKPENEIIIKKLKQKNTQDSTIDLNVELEDKEKKEKNKFRLFRRKE